MQPTPHDEGWRWLVGIALPSFILGVGWLVKHFMGRGSAVVQLGLQNAQAEEIRARIKREDESAAVTNLRAVAGELRADVALLRADRDEARAEGKRKDDRITELERQVKMLQDELLEREMSTIKRGTMLPPGG